MRLRPFGAALAALILAACATGRVGPQPSGPSPYLPPPGPPALSLADLPGWASEDHLGAFTAFRATCGASAEPALAEVCRRARSLGAVDSARARYFFEANFRPEPLSGAGVLTGYFSPEYPARSAPDAEFSAPLRAKPADLVSVDAGLFDPALAGKPGAAVQVDGALAPYPDRAAIEAQPVGKALAWMRPEELFFLQIQGSGVLTFPDGRRLKAGTAATNGRPFVGIANLMRDQGLLAPNDTSGDSIRNWLAAHRGPEADAVMRLNPRYVFFTLKPDDGRPPVGAAGVALPAGRAVAVDRSFHQMGDLLWVDGEAPVLAGAFPSYRRLVVALDVGGAIKGPVRADLYLGQGQTAGAEAGRVRHTLRLYRLAPKV